MRYLHVNGEFGTLFCLTKRCPNYIPVYMKVYYLFNLCLFKVFLQARHPKNIYVFDFLTQERK